MAYTTIDNPTDYFNTVLYSGNGSNGNAITGVGFSPEWLWIKQRSGTRNHNLWDIVRGNTKRLISNTTGAETTETSITSFDSDGFTLDSGTTSNENSQTFVAWNWLAGGSASSNSNGSITSSVSASTTAGFSIVSYTGTGSNATVGHGLGVAPSFVIIKDRGNAVSWVVSGDNIGWNKNVYLDSTQAVQTANHFQDTAPTSSLMYLATDVAVNGSSRNYIMYCFAEKQGYSKIGSYTGNGNADGTFVYTGFRPAWIMRKSTSRTNEWTLIDSTRSSFNQTNETLVPNASDAEDGDFDIDILSNGFKCRTSESAHNQSGDNFIYMAIAEHPFVTAGTKAAGTAR